MTDEQFARFERMFQELRTELKSEMAAMREQMATKEDLRKGHDGLGARIDDLRDEVRHTNTRVEDVHREVRLLAEAQTATNEKLDRVEARVDRIEGRLEHNVEPRLSAIEGRLEHNVEPRLSAIESGLANGVRKPRSKRRKRAGR
jgi:chromosome segregation ATPase